LVTSIHTEKTGLLRWETHVDTGRIIYTFQSMTRRRSVHRAIVFMNEQGLGGKKE
jgi:hypothetical protein